MSPSQCVFPHELEREIFEIAALHDQMTAFNLTLVARRTKEWIEPLLYRTLVLDFSDWDQQEQFEECIKRKPSEFFAMHVRNLCITYVDDFILKFTSMCKNLVNLACWAPTDSGEDILQPVITSLRLQRLVINLEMVFRPVDLSHSCFSRLTHLEVLDLESWWCNRPGYQHLTELTHVAFYNWSHDGEGVEVIQTILSDCNSLQRVVMVRCGSWQTADSLAGLDDPRLVFVDIHFTMVGSKDWERGARGGIDIWERADMALEERGRNFPIHSTV